MIHNHTLSFLRELKANNSKEWFHDHKHDYQEARENFLEVVNQLIQSISSFDEGIAASHLDPRKCVMRINRDIRFSPDKTPYKSNFFAFMNKDGKKSPYGGYYLSITPEESFQGGGIYMPESSVLAKIRQEIDYNYAEWENIVQDADLKKYYGEVKPSGKLSRPPKGYDKSNPSVEWLKFKGFYTQQFLSDAKLKEDNTLQGIVFSYKAVKPLVEFLNKSIAE
jgi:uncharacterized protein (TIGR02453 family)